MVQQPGKFNITIPVPLLIYPGVITITAPFSCTVIIITTLHHSIHSTRQPETDILPVTAKERQINSFFKQDSPQSIAPRLLHCVRDPAQLERSTAAAHSQISVIVKVVDSGLQQACCPCHRAGLPASPEVACGAANMLPAVC